MSDADFLDKIDPESKAWYEKFENEYYDNNVYGLDALHNTTALKKSVTDSTNARNRDQYGIMKCGKALEMKGTLPDLCPYNPGSVEDAVIGMIDGKRK